MVLGPNCCGVWSYLYFNGRSDYEATPLISNGYEECCDGWEPFYYRQTHLWDSVRTDVRISGVYVCVFVCVRVRVHSCVCVYMNVCVCALCVWYTYPPVCSGMRISQILASVFTTLKLLQYHQHVCINRADVSFQLLKLLSI